MRSISGGCDRVPGGAHIPPTKAPGRKIRDGSKRAFRRSITTWPGTSAGHGSGTRSAPSSTVHDARRERLARRRHAVGEVLARRERQPREAERAARGDCRAPVLGRAQHVRQVGRAAGDLQHRAVARALARPLGVPQRAVVLGHLYGLELHGRLARPLGRGVAAEAHEHAARAVLPRDVERVGLERLARQRQHRPLQRVRVVARRRARSRSAPGRDAGARRSTRSAPASRTSPRTASRGHSPRRS